MTGCAEEQNRLIDQIELNFESCNELSVSAQHSVSEFGLLHGAGVLLGEQRMREIEGKKVTAKDRNCPFGGQDHLMSTIDAIITTAAG